MIARALTIAGSDSGGGAGIQADLKTFTVFGVYGTSVVTALTAQNTLGIMGIHVVPAPFVRQQIEAVLNDIGVDAVKTGMLVNTEIIHAVAGALRDHPVQDLVVDPVMAAGTGTALLEPEACEVLVRDLVPLASLVTPNVSEAERMTGVPIKSVFDMHRAAAALIAGGAKACLVKGGHLGGDQAIDVLHDGKQTHELSAPRLSVRHTHGTGCQLSAAITASLARGRPLVDAVMGAKQFITTAIAHGLAIGQGAGPANPLAWREE
jgi:hydroxymethylpyrimidine/phosphomethylpyrimidine kinase